MKITKAIAIAFLSVLFTPAILANSLIPKELIGKWYYHGSMIEGTPELIQFNPTDTATIETVTFDIIYDSGTRHPTQISCIERQDVKIDSVKNENKTTIILDGKITKVEVLAAGPGSTVHDCNSPFRTNLVGVTNHFILTNVKTFTSFDIDYGNGVVHTYKHRNH